jgi:hypothetical protein
MEKRMSHKILRLTLGAIGLLLTMVVFEGPIATARDDVSTDAGTCAPKASDAACFEEAEAAPEVL